MMKKRKNGNKRKNHYKKKEKIQSKIIKGMNKNKIMIQKKENAAMMIKWKIKNIKNNILQIIKIKEKIKQITLNKDKIKKFIKTINLSKVIQIKYKRNKTSKLK